MSLPIVYTNDVYLGNEDKWVMGVTGSSFTSYDIQCRQFYNGGFTGPNYSMVKYPTSLYRGKTLIVDSVNGNDSYGTEYPYSYPFKTVGQAINSSVSGDTVFLYPGTYAESLNIKSGIAVRGINVQTVAIQKINVVADTTLVTMDSNCRLEDVTLNLTGATGGIKLTGLELINTAPQTSKLRAAVVNVSNYDTRPSTAYGVLSSGTTSNVEASTSTNAIRASTINVNLGSTGSTGCAILVSGANRTTCRDTNFFAKGPTGYDGNTETHISACCVNSPAGNTGALGLHTSTLSGATYDVARENGNFILFGFTDLVNSTTNGNSFNVATQATIQSFCLTGNFNSSSTYYLTPGSISIGDASTSDYLIFFDQNVVIISVIIDWQGVSIPVGQSITVNVHRNSSATPSLYTAVLNSTTSTVIDRSKSVTFKSTDKMIIEVVVSGSIGRGILLVSTAEY